MTDAEFWAGIDADEHSPGAVTPISGANEAFNPPYNREVKVELSPKSPEQVSLDSIEAEAKKQSQFASRSAIALERIATSLEMIEGTMKFSQQALPPGVQYRKTLTKAEMEMIRNTEGSISKGTTL